MLAIRLATTLAITHYIPIMSKQDHKRDAHYSTRLTNKEGPGFKRTWE